MPPVRVVCPNCEAEEIRECDAGEDTAYRCAGASESEIDARSGCGTLHSFKEFKEMKAAAMAAGGTKNNSAAKSTATAASSRAPLATPAKLPMRRPLASLHSRTPLHGTATKPPTNNVTAPSSLTPPSSASVPASPTLLAQSTKPAAVSPTAKVTPPAKPAAAKPVDNSDEDEEEGGGGGDDSDSSDSTPAPTTKSAAKPSAAGGKKKTTGGKSVSSPKNSTTTDASFNLADPAVSAADRMRALKAKLAKQREQAQIEFQAKYGVEGDEETEEERQAAQRKRSGEAGEEFLSMSQGGGEIARAPMLGSLTVKGQEDPLAVGYRRPFTTPRTHGAMSNSAKALIAERQKTMHVGRRLGARLRIFNGTFGGFKALDSTLDEEDDLGEPLPPPPPVVLSKADEAKTAPTGFQPLVIWSPTPEELAANPNLTAIEVPMLVCKWLRPHQREGVKFMCECVLGQRNLTSELNEKETPQVKTIENADGTTTTVQLPPAVANLGGGAILADDMGLGKTLQSVALLYTLLTQGFEVNSPVARKVIIVTPTSLVSNWANEIEKWLGKGKVNVVALSEVGKDNISCGIDSFVQRGSKMHVLIISYDTFRRNVERLNKPGLCDLLICDEAHRLKNNKTSTYTTLDSLPCKRRVLLSGTPMQNDLSEFFSMINFTNRNIIGDRKMFRKYYELPILLGREPDCLESDAAEGSERASELSAIVNQFVLRRTNMLLRQHLPPKVIQVVCCRPSALQVKLYQHFLNSGAIKKLTRSDEAEEGRASGGLQALPLITSLKKLCNHPKLIWDTVQAVGDGKKKGGATIKNEDGVAEKVPAALMAIFKGIGPIFQSHESGAFLRSPHDARWGGKMYVLERLLTQIRISNCGDRVVIVSNFTSALDVISTMCQTRKWDCLRLDGSTSIKKRQQLVDQLSDHRGNKVFVFLLSSRAGGCGLNLIGANRLILFDPDWNPAVDKQAAARVWRDGQTKRCFVYRFLTTGSIEEKVYQRQLSKEGLSGVLGGSTADASLTKDELRDLFTLDESALEQPSDTHKGLECECLDQYLIKSEAEADRVEELAKQEAVDQAKKVEEAAREEAAKIKAEAEANGEQPSSAASDSPSAAATTDDAKMDDVEPGAPTATTDDPMEGETADGVEGAEGGNGGGGGDASSDDGDDDDAEMNDFIADDDDDDGGEEYGSKKKSSKAKAKKPSKKDGPRKQRKKRTVVGALNFPALHALATCTLGQRGEPPEEELINWAHHATSNSIPDPLFRAAARTMPFTRGHLPYVSFVFSCEVSGKAIQNSTDAVDAQAVSARCEEAPMQVAASKPAVVSLEQAKAKHAEFMAGEMAKQRKRAGNDEYSLEERLADPSKRRHSSRVRQPAGGQQRNDEEDDEDDEDRAFIAPDGEEGEGEPGAEGQPSGDSRKRKAVAAEPDAETLKLIQELQNQDLQEAIAAGRKRGGGKKAAATNLPKKGRGKKAAANAMEDVEETAADAPVSASASPLNTSSSSVEEVSPAKKRKAEDGSAAPATTTVASQDDDFSLDEDIFKAAPTTATHASPKKPATPNTRSPALKPSTPTLAPTRASPRKAPPPASASRVVRKPHESDSDGDSIMILEEKSSVQPKTTNAAKPSSLSKLAKPQQHLPLPKATKPSTLVSPQASDADSDFE